MYTTALLLVCAFHFIQTQECLFPHRTLEEAWEEQLTKDLYDKYGSHSPPNETTKINVHFLLKYFSLEDDETTFNAYSWLLLSWSDVRLKWNPSDYKGVSELIHKNYKFWEPSIRTLNMDYEEYEFPMGECKLEKEGDVTCVPRILPQAPCNTKLTNWPFDTQNCTIQLGFFTPNANIDLEESRKVAVVFGAEYGTEWTIFQVYQEFKNWSNPVRPCNKAKKLYLTFFIAREGASLGAIVIVPSILLTVLALSSFLLTVQDKIRLSVISFNLLCHFMFITELGDLIPKHSEDSPTVLFYLRGSVLVNVLLVMFTMFLVYLRNKTNPITVQLVTFIDSVLKSKINFMIWPRWKAGLRKRASEEERVIFTQWADLANILNSLCLWLVIIVYVCFISLYIPRPFGLDAYDL